MATTTTTKATTTKKATARRTRSTSSLGKISLNKMFKDISKPTGIGFGIYAGHRFGMLIDKHTGTVSGFLGEDGKKFIKPALNILIGMSLSQVANQDFVKYVGYGIAVNGGFSLIKDGFGKNVLKGLNGNEDFYLPELPPDNLDLLQIEGLKDDDDIEDLELEELERQITEEIDTNASDISGLSNKVITDIDEDLDFVDIE